MFNVVAPLPKNSLTCAIVVLSEAKKIIALCVERLLPKRLASSVASVLLIQKNVYVARNQCAKSRMNYLESLVAEWLEYRGYFVRRNVKVGKRQKGG